ncbi:odorant receptor 82a-like [Microplitis mediator]|uniref:odorant receptor 82a-like n=1 Tax=Microplitis mediator TaxID=375433 RepID=UPI0025568986|nr:odorant receptor 82a-like [Microplitis mediator]
MDTYEESYYKIMINFLCFLGLWPYQPRLKRVLYPTALWISHIVQLIPQIIIGIVDSDDAELLFELLTVFVQEINCMIKFLNMINKAKMIKILLKRIPDDWMILQSDEEENVFKYHLSMGKLMSVGYAAIMFISTVLYLMDPIIPIFVNTISKSNDSVPHKFTTPMKFIIFDEEKYYWLLLSLSTICVSLFMIVYVCCDVVFISLVQHVGGIFAVVGFRLENSPIVGSYDSTIEEKKIFINSEDIIYNHFVSCVRDHKRALESSQLIEEIYTLSLGALVVLNLPVMSATGVKILSPSATIEDIVKNILDVSAQLVYLFFNCYMAQKLTDMSFYVHYCIARVNWYNNSPKSKKLLFLMTLRSQVPCKLTAGKIIELSIENFGMMVKTAGSYFTVLLSMRQAT